MNKTAKRLLIAGISLGVSVVFTLFVGAAIAAAAEEEAARRGY